MAYDCYTGIVLVLCSGGGWKVPLVQVGQAFENHSWQKEQEVVSTVDFHETKPGSGHSYAPAL